jgi:flagellin-like hook-associated protein FlgL
MDEFDRIGESAEFNGIKLLRNRNGETVQLMAGITGADTSLLQVAAVNSHRYAGEYGVRSNFNEDIFIDAADVDQIMEYYQNPKTYPETTNNPELYPSYGMENVTNSAGRQTSIRFFLGRLIDDLNNGSSVEQLPINPSSLDIYYRADDSEGGTAANYATFSSGVKEFSFTDTLSNGATFTLSLDLSELTISTLDRVVHSQSPSNIGLTNIESKTSSKNALDTVRNRINTLSTLEGQIGAITSRLEVARNVLAASGENFAAASSRIKDADIAAESANVVRTQILQQTSASLLGQANLAPQIGLQLLQNA